MTKITKEEFKAYEKVRSSGVTNMFMVNVVEELSGLSREKNHCDNEKLRRIDEKIS